MSRNQVIHRPFPMLSVWDVLPSLQSHRLYNTFCKSSFHLKSDKIRVSVLKAEVDTKEVFYQKKYCLIFPSYCQVFFTFQTNSVWCLGPSFNHLRPACTGFYKRWANSIIVPGRKGFFSLRSHHNKFPGVCSSKVLVTLKDVGKKKKKKR